MKAVVISEDNHGFIGLAAITFGLSIFLSKKIGSMKIPKFGEKIMVIY